MTKAELRTIYLQKRISLSGKEYELLNISLCQNFFESVELSSIKTLHTFLPLKKNKEPDTALIISRIKEDFSRIRIILPKVNVQSQQLENYFFENTDQLELNKWGIHEPKNGTLANAEEIDMILVPLLAFDKSGNRVGYGKGFYDKLLQQCKPSCHRVGLSLYPPVEDAIETNSYDQKLTKVITAGDVFTFS